MRLEWAASCQINWRVLARILWLHVMWLTLKLELYRSIESDE